MRKLVAIRTVLWNGRLYHAGEALPTSSPVAEVWVENEVARWADVLNDETGEMTEATQESQQADETLVEVDLDSEAEPEGDVSSVLDGSKPEREPKRVGRNKPKNLL